MKGTLFLICKGAGRCGESVGSCGLLNDEGLRDQCCGDGDDEPSGDRGWVYCSLFSSSEGGGTGGGVGNLARLDIGKGALIFARSALYMCTGSCTMTGLGAGICMGAEIWMSL